ncbi:MAG: glycoside hydrolase domain-containing protein, partial [Candidatus Brocadiia bacterium]
AVTAHGYDNPNKAYKLYSRCWLQYEEDLHTQGLFHMGASGDEVLNTLDMGSDEESGDEGGVLEEGGGASKSSASAPDGLRSEELEDSSMQPEPALVCGEFEKKDEGGKFGPYLSLDGPRSVIVTPSYGELPKDGHFAVEAWFRPTEKGGTIFFLSGSTPISLRSTSEGELVASYGDKTVKSTDVRIRDNEWQHIALVVTPDLETFRDIYGTHQISDDSRGVRSIGRFEVSPPQHDSQLRIVVNGEIAAAKDDASLERTVKNLNGRVRVGNDRDGEDPFRVDIDELRISDQARKYYPARLGSMQATEGDDFPTGQPFLRDREDEVIHLGLDESLSGDGVRPEGENNGKTVKYMPGVHGLSAVAGPGGQSPEYTLPDELSARSGTLEFWFSPYDWDNGKADYVKERRREEPPTAIVPLVGLSSREGSDGDEHWLLKMSAHTMTSKNDVPDLKIVPGRWYHVVVTFDHGRARVYLNGELLDTDMISSRWSVSPADHTLHRLVFGDRFPWEQNEVVYQDKRNLIDEVRLYSRPLTPPEVQNAYARFAPEHDLKELPYAFNQQDMHPVSRRISVDTTVLHPDYSRIKEVLLTIGDGDDGGTARSLRPSTDGRAWDIVDGAEVDSGEKQVSYEFVSEEDQTAETMTELMEVPERPFAEQLEDPPYKMAYYPYPHLLRFVFKPLWENNPVRADFLSTSDGHGGLRGSYYDNADCDGEPVVTRIDPTVDFKWNESPAHNVPDKYFGVVWEGSLGPIPSSGEYEISVDADGPAKLWIGDEKVVDTAGEDGSNSVQMDFQEGEEPDVRLKYSQKRGDPRCQLQWKAISGLDREQLPDAEVRVTDEEDEEIVRDTTEIDRWGEGTVDVGELPDGKYRVHVTMPTGEKEYLRWFSREHFDWEHNTLGITDEVLPPFEPIEVNDGRVDVVMRRYRIGELGLWESVRARGNDSDFRELLAEPVQVVVNEKESLAGEGNFTEKGEQEVVYEGSASHPAVNLETRATTEYDGCTKVEMTLKPGTEEQELRRLHVDIPMKDGEAPLWHALKTLIRGNPAGKTPSGEGRIWASTQFRDKRWPGNFKPYIWLGGAERGISWFADNEKGWVIDWDEQPPCQTLHRENGVLTLRLHLVQKPVVLDEPRTITFGLMASPAKPMRKDWRAMARPDRRGVQFSMGHVFGLPAAYAAKYPVNKDFSTLDAFYKLRQGQRVDEQKVAERWVDQNLNHEGATRQLRSMYRGLVANGIGRGTSRDFFSAYFDEFRGTTTFCEEHPTFRCSWDMKEVFLRQVQGFTERFGTKITDVSHRRWFFGSGTMVPSYRDFATWFGAKWLRRSAGLYFDNVFPVRSWNPYLTNAYRREDGQIQPSTQMWARREYLKRIWVLHKELFMPETPQIMMTHMTNAHVVPWQSFNQVNLDLEWRGGPRPFQPKFSPDHLRAESIGRQSGCVPTAIAEVEPKEGSASEVDLKRGHRTRAGGFMVHEILPEWSGQDWPEEVFEFGYGLEECEVYNYWDDDAPVEVSDESCKWLLLQRGDRLMLILCTWNKEDSEVEIRIDFDSLGVDPGKVVDAEHPDRDEVDDLLGDMPEDDGEDADAETDMGEDLEEEHKDPGAWQGTIEFDEATGRITVPLVGYGVRMLRIE